MDENNQPQRAEAYVNHLGVQVNPYEFALKFGITDLENLEDVRHVTTLRMSPQHAKSVMLLLQTFISLYEQQIAPISLPKELTEQVTGQGASNDPDRQN